MTQGYKLNTRGLNYLISSADACAIRHFLLYVLTQSIRQYQTMEQMLAWDGMSNSELTRLVKKMLDLDWLVPVTEEDNKPEDINSKTVLRKLSELSSTGNVLLADDKGLVIQSSGFDKQRAEHLAASSARLLAVNEIARQRNTDLYNGQLWYVSMHWGKHLMRAQYICLGALKFILLMEGRAQQDSPEFYNLIAYLFWRYAHES